VRPGGVPGVENPEQHRSAERSRRSLGGPVGQPLRPQVVHHQPGHALAQADQVLRLPGIEAVPDHRQEFRGGGEENRPALSDQAVDSRRSQVGLPIPRRAMQIHPGNLSLDETDDHVVRGHHPLIRRSVEALERALLERATKGRVARDALPQQFHHTQFAELADHVATP